MTVSSATTIPTITSVYEGTNAGLIAHVWRLYVGPNSTLMDVTFGEGKWWHTREGPIGLIKHDLFKLDGVDFRHLPEPDASIDVVMFDPPYMTPGGRTTTGIGEMWDRYGMTTTPRTPRANADMIDEGLKEIVRVLRPGGYVLAKCMDYICSGTFQPGHRWMVEGAMAAGLEQVDEVIHVTGTGPQPTKNRDGSPRRQVHTRRAHSFLCIFTKPVSHPRARKSP